MIENKQPKILWHMDTIFWVWRQFLHDYNLSQTISIKIIEIFCCTYEHKIAWNTTFKFLNWHLICLSIFRYNKNKKTLDLQICQQDLDLAKPQMMTKEQAPPQMLLSDVLPFGTSQTFKFDSPPNISGMTVHKKRYRTIMPASVPLLSETKACPSTSPRTVSVTSTVSQQKRPKPVLRNQTVKCNQCGDDRTASSLKAVQGLLILSQHRTTDL